MNETQKIIEVLTPMATDVGVVVLVLFVLWWRGLLSPPKILKDPRGSEVSALQCHGLNEEFMRQFLEISREHSAILRDLANTQNLLVRSSERHGTLIEGAVDRQKEMALHVRTIMEGAK